MGGVSSALMKQLKPIWLETNTNSRMARTSTYDTPILWILPQSIQHLCSMFHLNLRSNHRSVVDVDAVTAHPVGHLYPADQLYKGNRLNPPAP